jgi:hypothetical protein
MIPFGVFLWEADKAERKAMKCKANVLPFIHSMHSLLIYPLLLVALCLIHHYGEK